MSSETEIGQASSSAGYANNASIVKYRLDTGEIIERIKEFLKGEVTITTIGEDGNTKFTTLRSGEKLCNDKGIQGILSWVSFVINPQVVQGNYKEEWYVEYIAHQRDDFADLLIIKMRDWEIDESDLHSIATQTMALIEPYMSRLIGDGERKSYIGFESKEVQTRQSGGLSSIIPFMGGK